MNNSFSISRFALLLKKDFTENIRLYAIGSVSLLFGLATLMVLGSPLICLPAEEGGAIFATFPIYYLFCLSLCIAASMMFPQFRTKQGRLSVFMLPATNAEKYAEVYGAFYPRFSMDDMMRYLKVFEMNDLDVNLKALSMGQKKKVFMSFAFATNTRVLLMDEPTNGLDIPSKSQFRKIVATGMSDDKIMVLSTHQVRDVDSILDYVLIIDNNRTLLDASIAEIGQRLKFEISNNVEGAIYYQPTINGNMVVKPNIDNVETNIDIEALFNATLCNPVAIGAIFAK